MIRRLRTTSSSLGLGAAFPLAAAAEPVAHGGKQCRVAIENGREWQRQRPEPREAVKSDRRAVRRRHYGNGGAREQPSRIIQNEEANPCEQESHKQAGQCSDKQQEGIVQLGES